MFVLLKEQVVSKARPLVKLHYTISGLSVSTVCVLQAVVTMHHTTVFISSLCGSEMEGGGVCACVREKMERQSKKENQTDNSCVCRLPTIVKRGI